MQQIHILICIALCISFVTYSHSAVQYKSQKIRGPPLPKRLTRNPQHIGTYQHQHYNKAKWTLPSRGPSRPSHVRPIPVHMASYKVPVITRPPTKTPTPLVFPSAVWKTPTAVYRPPVENVKPYFVSPPVPTISQQFDYHFNKEPVMNIPTIKQIGEKGPIHTIPAPNLSPADRPKIIYEQPAKQSYHYPKIQEISANSIHNSYSTNSISPAALIGAQALPLVSSIPLPQLPASASFPEHTASSLHQYQVTENAEGPETLPANIQMAFSNQKPLFAPDPDAGLIQKLTSQYPQDMFMTPQQFVSNAANVPLSPQDLYQLLNGVPQQQLVDSYGMPLMQQPQLQQHLIQQAAQSVPSQNYQLLQPQLLGADSSAYFNQIPDTVSQQIKDNFNPQFHSFNYEEPKRDSAQSRLTAEYSIEPEATDSSPKAVQQNPNEALAQTQYIQQYFATREDTNVAENELEKNEDASRETQLLSQLGKKPDISSTMFYSSLPSKEAAQALATLQAAGSINNLLKGKQHQNEPNTNANHNNRDSMRIYVPDEETYDDLETSDETNNKDEDGGNQQSRIRVFETTHLKQQNIENRSGESSEYEDYSGEENISNESVDQETNFGSKINKTSAR